MAQSRGLVNAVMGSALAFAILLPVAPVQADSRIKTFEYDESGRFKSATEKKGENDGATPGAPGDPSATDGPATDGSKGDGASSEQGEFVPGEILVLDPPQGLENRLGSFGLTLLERTRLKSLSLDAWRLKVKKDGTETQALEALRRAYPDIQADLNSIYALQSRSLNQDYSRPTVGWTDIPATCGTGVRIGVIDTGVDSGIEMLTGQRIVRRSFADDHADVVPEDHGTAVALLLIGRTDRNEEPGLLPGAQLYAADIFQRGRDGRPSGSLMAMIKAIDWLTEHRVHSINLSLAGSRNAVLLYAVNRALTKGMVLVAAAGNNGPDAVPAWPAAHPKVISVTAIDAGYVVYSAANQGSYIDFAAPGVSLWTMTPGGGKYQSGTSFAAPFVTAMTALLVAGGSRTDPEVLRDTLRRYAIDLGQPGKDSVFGWGLVRARPPC
ncbi:MAG: S8 family serine peptidase [Alphaproteobacteria bacterium]